MVFNCSSLPSFRQFYRRALIHLIGSVILNHGHGHKWSQRPCNVYISIAVSSFRDLAQRIHATVQQTLTSNIPRYIDQYYVLYNYYTFRMPPYIDQYSSCTDSPTLWYTKLIIKWTETLHQRHMYCYLPNSQSQNVIFFLMLGSCGTPRSLTNGQTSYTSTTVGSIVTYTCDPGYMMTAGNSSRTCQSDGLWSGNLPTCTRKSTLLQLFLLIIFCIIVPKTYKILCSIIFHMRKMEILALIVI